MTGGIGETERERLTCYGEVSQAGGGRRQADAKF